MRKLTMLMLALCLLVGAAQAADDLSTSFVNPPASARPWVYWFWLNGNITREGITADLEAMKRVGIGGVLIMEVDQGAPLGPVGFMSPQWQELFKWVVAEAQRLGLQVNMNNDAGWDGSGGPWVKPAQSMQKVVWSETDVAGPQHFDGTLPQPKAVADFYRDITVLAFPTPGPYRINGIQVKAYYQVGNPGPAAQTKLPAEMVIPRDSVIDLSAKMDPSGHLAWDVPAGKWTVLRLGHTSTGVQNHPAPASGCGLECDKLSKDGIDANYAGMMEKLIADVGPAAGNTLITTHIDSWENGAQNWTEQMRQEFQRRRGYDPLPFLPVMTGRVIGSLEISERFLWDLRQTVSELVVEDYAGRLADLVHQHGMKLSIEAYGGPCDNLTYAGRADEPMGEFWVGGGVQICKEMAGAAHTYGKPILGAESCTANSNERWLEYPGSVKHLVDEAFCAGVNRLVFHRYAMQPWTANYHPGMTMGPWGLHYERTETWWEQSRPWHEYLSRCQFMLRQGRYAADLCYLEPEASSQGMLQHAPNAYDYDNCSAEVVLTRMTVQDGRLVLPDGMSYRVLVLPDVPTMTPALLRKIRDLVQAGATVVGPRPTRSPGLSDYPQCDTEVRQLAAELWGDCDGQSVKEHRFGKGRVVWGIGPDAVLKREGVGPDFTGPDRLTHIHRSDGDTDIYFVANPLPQNVDAVCTFRVSSKRPELWWPQTGRIEPAPMFYDRDGATRVLLPLGPAGSVFVVFRGSDKQIDPVVAISRGGKSLLTVTGETPKIVVEKAVYGVPGDPKRTRDVRAKVQQIVDDGESSFQVARLVQGDDPAFGVVKTLTVDYTVGGRHCTITGQDPDTVFLTDQAVKIVIDKAVYGVLNDPKRTRDVRAKVQHMVDLGENSFQVAELARGDDPAFRVVKTAIIDYTIDGKHYTASSTDPDIICLVPVTMAERVAELHSNAAGQTLLETAHAGKYESKTASGRTHSVTIALPPQPVAIGGPWEVRFDPKWGGPATPVTFTKLEDWSKRPEEGIRYYSGTATYKTTIHVPRDLSGKKRRLYLDLGEVAVMAQVKLNGKDLGILWKSPYRIDVTGLVKAGYNSLEVQVTNLWPNRMIGDEQLPDDSVRNLNGTLKEWPQWVLDGKPSPTGRFTFTTWRLWKKDDPLQTSGLIGPVRLVTTEAVAVE